MVVYVTDGLTAGQRAAHAVEAGGTKEAAASHGATWADVKLARVIRERTPDVFASLKAGEFGVQKAHKLMKEATGRLCPHPAAEIFPMASAQDRAALRASLEESGYRAGEPPVLLHRDGRIIDGRNRAAVCVELGIEYPTEVYEGDEESILALVLSRNLARRHLSDGQRAMVAAKMANLTKGRPGKMPPLAAFTRPDAAKAMNVSEHQVERAKKVLASGDKQLIADVESGKVKVAQAARALGPAPRKKPTREGLKVAESDRPAKAESDKAASPRQRQEPNPYEDVALQFSNAINRIDEISARVDAAVLRAVFPDELVKNLDIALERASEFLAAMRVAHAATRKNAADGPAAHLNLH